MGMSIDRSIVRPRGAAALLIVAALLLGHPGTVAHADGGTGVAFADSGTFTTQVRDGGHLLTVSGTFNGTVVGNTLVEAIACTATSTPDAATSTVSACTLNGIAAPATSMPGAVATTAASVTLPLSGLAGISMCATGSAAFAESVAGTSSLTASRCQSSSEAVSTDGTWLGISSNKAPSHITYWCASSATGGVAVSTTSTCRLEQRNGNVVASSAQTLPGELAFSDGSADLPAQSYILCAGGSAAFLDGVVAPAAQNCS